MWTFIRQKNSHYVFILELNQSSKYDLLTIDSHSAEWLNNYEKLILLYDQTESGKKLLLIPLSSYVTVKYSQESSSESLEYTASVCFVSCKVLAVIHSTAQTS